MEVMLIVVLQTHQHRAGIRDAQPLTEYTYEEEAAVAIRLLADVHEFRQFLLIQAASEEHRCSHVGLFN